MLSRKFPRLLRAAALALPFFAIAGCTESFVSDLPKGPSVNRLEAHRTATGVVLSVPGCPDWSKEVRHNYSNSVHSNFGCADATNLGLMIANPEDVLEGRNPGAADGTYAAGAIERYRKGETKPLQAGGAVSGDASGGETTGGQ